MNKTASIGNFLEEYGQMEVLESIDENIILSDAKFNVQWANPAGASFLRKIAKLYGVTDEKQMIGMNMNHFHAKSSHQEGIMNSLEATHKAVIHFKDKYTAEIIVNPVRNKEGQKVGYSILLLDVTDKLKEQEEREQLIHDMSVPILKVWKSVLAVPLKGALDEVRFAVLTEQLMNACADYNAKYVLLDLSGIQVEEVYMLERLNQLQYALKLIGTEPITVGISPKLAMSLSKAETDWLTFNSVEYGIRYILKKENMQISK